MNKDLQLIDQGTYGCVFYPGINCKGKKENVRYVTKIQKNTDLVKHELEIAAFIRKIPRYSYFFAPIIKQCPVQISKKLIPNVKKCDLFKNSNDEQMQKQEYISNKIKYLGEENIMEYIISSPTWIECGKSLFKCHYECLMAYKLLAARDIIHFDVKYDNIMFDETANRPVIIDFGISIHIPSLKTETDFKNAFYAFVCYAYWPIDVIMCNYIFSIVKLNAAKTDLVSVEELNNIINTYFQDSTGETNALFRENTVIDKDTASATVADMKTKYMDYYKSFVGKPWYSIYEDIISKKQYLSWDNYGLCATMLLILSNIKHIDISFYESLITNPDIQLYIKHLQSVIYTTPDKRPTVKSSLSIIKKLVTGKL